MDAAARAPRITIQGRSLTLPCVVRDASSASAIFAVDAARARALLPAALEPAGLWPGRALLSIAAIDYRDNDLGDYDEVSIALFARPRGAPGGALRTARELLRGGPGTFIRWLPVSQAFTCEAGRSVWGFPKSVEEIALGARDGRFHCSLRAGGRLVLRFSIPHGGTRVLPDTEMRSYTVIQGVTHCTRFTSGASQVGVHLGGAELILGDHPVAGELRRLGLPRRALVSTWMGRMHGRFFAPEKL